MKETLCLWMLIWKRKLYWQEQKITELKFGLTLKFICTKFLLTKDLNTLFSLTTIKSLSAMGKSFFTSDKYLFLSPNNKLTGKIKNLWTIIPQMCSALRIYLIKNQQKNNHCLLSIWKSNFPPSGKKLKISMPSTLKWSTKFQLRGKQSKKGILSTNKELASFNKTIMLTYLSIQHYPKKVKSL